MALNQTCHLDTWYGWHCRTCGRIVSSQSFPITISALNGDTEVMQVYAETLVEDLRAMIAESGGDFVELRLYLGDIELRGNFGPRFVPLSPSPLS